MLHLYLSEFYFTDLRLKAKIDMSKIPTENLADECDNIVQHHKDCSLFFGYLEPGWMLDPKHEARIRQAIRKFDVYMVCFHLESIPFSWKNEIHTIYVKKGENGHSTLINDGCAVHTESEAEDGRVAKSSSD